MEKVAMFVIVVLHSIFFAQAQDSVVPSRYNYTALKVLAVNGSSATGGCSDVLSYLTTSYSTCATPTSSVLFDGVNPTLTALDGNSWAEQLMIIQGSSENYFSFTDITRVRRLEVVMFNCPQWDTNVYYIQVWAWLPNRESFPTAYTPVHSCDSLVKVCIPIDTYSLEIRVFFNSHRKYIHLAEVAFYESSTPCPPFTIIPGNWTPPTTQGIQFQPSTARGTSHQPSTSGGTSGTRSSQAENKENPSLIVPAISMIAALQTTVVVFLVVVVVGGVVCMYSKRKTTSKPHNTTESVEMEDQLYEAVGPGEGVANKNKPSRERGKGKEKIEFKENGSYAMHFN